MGDDSAMRRVESDGEIFAADAAAVAGSPARRALRRAAPAASTQASNALRDIVFRGWARAALGAAAFSAGVGLALVDRALRAAPPFDCESARRLAPQSASGHKTKPLIVPVYSYGLHADLGVDVPRRMTSRFTSIDWISLFCSENLFQNRGMILGYARVSTDAQDLISQVARLKAAGCERTFREKVSRRRTGSSS